MQYIPQQQHKYCVLKISKKQGQKIEQVEKKLKSNNKVNKGSNFPSDDFIVRVKNSLKKIIIKLFCNVKVNSKVFIPHDPHEQGPKLKKEKFCNFFLARSTLCRAVLFVPSPLSHPFEQHKSINRKKKFSSVFLHPKKEKKIFNARPHPYFYSIL